MKGNLKETVYETKHWNAKPEGISHCSNSTNYLYDLNPEEKVQNAAYQYHEMLKNTIDFSESLNAHTANQEEDLFFAEHWPRKEIGLMKTKSRQRLVDLFKSEEGFECAGSFANEGSVLLDSTDHDYFHPICFDETRSMDNGLSGDNLSNAILGNQSHQSRLSSYTSGAASDISESQSITNLQMKTEEEPRPLGKPSEEHFRASASQGNNIQIVTNQGLDFAEEQDLQKIFLFNEEELNFDLLNLADEKEVSGGQSLSTRNSIESSLHSPESLKKWTEVSINLYANSSHKTEPETEEVSLRGSRKRKKTENFQINESRSSVGQHSDQMESETNSLQFSLSDKMSLEEQEEDAEKDNEFYGYNYPKRSASEFEQEEPYEQENFEFNENLSISKNRVSPRNSTGKRIEATPDCAESLESAQSSSSFNEDQEASSTQSPSQVSNLPANEQNSSANWSFCPLQSCSSTSYPRLTPEAVTAILNQYEPKELLANLPISPEILEEIERSNIISKIKNANQKRIGPLSVEERRIKVEKFFEKRKQRSWNKRINYQCRKEVADSRLRIKGRFVTRNQARVLLGDEYNIDTLSNDQIRELLHKKFEEGSGCKIQNIDLVLKNHQKNRLGSKHC